MVVIQQFYVKEKETFTIEYKFNARFYRRLYGRGKFMLPPPSSPLPPIQTSVKCCDLRSWIFVSFQQITYKLGNCTNLKALFPVELTDFP